MQFNNPASTKKLETKNMATQSITNSINRSPWRRAFLFIPLVLVCAAAYGPAPALRAQQPSAFTLSSATRHGPAKIARPRCPEPRRRANPDQSSCYARLELQLSSCLSN